MIARFYGYVRNSDVHGMEHPCCQMFVLVVLSAFMFPLQISAATLAEDSSAKAVVVVAEDAPPPERHAAAELADFLGEITGGRFEVVHSLSDSKSNLLVGPDAAKMVEANLSTQGLGAEGLIIRTVGNDMILAGGYPRGTLYAVYTFLEQQLGCRWWSSKVSTIPEKPSLTIKEVDVRFVPILELRQISWLDSLDIDWTVRNKLNGDKVRLDAQHGKSHIYAGFVHTFVNLIPPAKYFDQHPEWFSLRGGQRKAELDVESLNPHAKLTQLCLTNQEMRQELVKNLKVKLRANPKATIASVSQNDGKKYCQCPECEAFNQEQGSQAGTMINFVNEVAADIEEEFPDMVISTLAYDYTRKAPRTVKPRHNVSVQLCSIECSFGVPLSDDRNKKFRNDMIEWSRICDRLYIWDYTTNFRHYFAPHPNLRVMGPNIKFFAEHGAKGIYEQGCSLTEGADMAELRAWVQAKLLWDPNLDAQELIDEFIAGYYGPAGVHVKTYLDVIHDAADKHQDFLNCYADLPQSHIKVRWETPERLKSKFINFETLSQGWKHLKAGEAKVIDDPDLRFRVQVAELPVMYSLMLCWKNMRSDAVKAGADWPFSDSIEDVYNDFMEIAKKKKVTRLSERIPGFYAVDEALKKFGE